MQDDNRSSAALTGFNGRLIRLLRVEPQELKPLLLSFGYYFCLLCGYYILRPVRDEMGIQGGVGNLQWVFTATFAVMLLAVPLFGWAVARYPRRQLVPRVYYFFIANLALFFLLFKGGIGTAWVARAFFVWVSVFNLFVVSVFWSFMADIFSNRQARRLFGIIAAGGSAGAIAGPGLTASLGVLLGPANLLPISMGFLLLAVICVHALLNRRGPAWAAKEAPAAEKDDIIGGGVLAGAVRVMRSPYLLGICLFMVLFTSLSTFLYFEQAHIVNNALADSGQRTRLFAGMDLAVNSLTVLCQLFLTARLVERFGIAPTLMLIPVFLAGGFFLLGLYPTLAVLVLIQVLRRAGNYAITRPAREVLYTVIPREDKYKSKNFIDTVVYRGGDALSGWAFAGLIGFGLNLSAIAFAAVPLALLWTATGFWLGRKQERLQAQYKRFDGEWTASRLGAPKR